MKRHRAWRLCAICALTLALISAAAEAGAAEAWIARYNDLAAAQGVFVIAQDKVKYDSAAERGFTYMGDEAYITARFFINGGMSELSFQTLSKDVNVEGALRALILATDAKADADAALEALDIKAILNENSGYRAMQAGDWYYEITCMPAGENRFFSFTMSAPGQIPEGGIWDGLWGDDAPDAGEVSPAPPTDDASQIYHI